MTSRLLELGIQSINNQQLDEGARLIRIALREPMADKLRAVGYLWLAETTSDPSLRLDFYRQAQEYDPDNADINQRMSALLTSQLPPMIAQQAAPNPSMMPPAAPITGQPLPLPDVFPGQPPTEIAAMQHVVGISGGPNGIGSGCFVHPQGIIATTRAVVGMNSQLDVFLTTGQSMRGFVLRSYPMYDLAFIRVNVFARQIPPGAAPGSVAENAPLSMLDHRGQALRAGLLPMREVIAPHWFATTVETVPDAGGNPIYEPHGTMVGLMTNNTFRGGKQRFGLHTAAIMTLLGQFATEMQQLAPNSPVYCPSCGSTSRALLYGGFYCEACGAVLPHFAQKARYPQANNNTILLYDETHPPCPRCGARIGYYKHKCLRCEVNTT